MSYRFDYVKYDDSSIAKSAKIRLKFEELEAAIMAELEDGRARQLCLTNVEQAFMWTGKSIRDSQIKRTKQEGP